MADDPTEKLADYFKELMAKDEERTKAIQDQLEQQWKTHQKAVANLLDQHLKAQKKAVRGRAKNARQDVSAAIAPGHREAPPPRR